jgi:glycolate oxidase
VPPVADVVELLGRAVGAAHVRTGAEVHADLTHDECLTVDAVVPRAVVAPADTAEVVALVQACAAAGVPLTARGSGTGLSGACTPRPDGVVVSFERMDRVLEVDDATHIAVVQPGVRLEQLDAELAPRGLRYPVYPGEYSSSIGGNVATNAGGMRAVKHGVTRHHVLGLEVVLGTGEVIRTGGRIVKASSGYDITQLVIGSEGTLGLVTEAILKLSPRPAAASTVLAPFGTLEQVAAAVPQVISSGVQPALLEYIDLLTMSAMQSQFGLDLGIPEEIKASALAYLVVEIEGSSAERVDEDVQQVATHLVALGADDAYVLPPGAATALIGAREKAFWVAKANAADDIVDIAVPRASIPAFMDQVRQLADDHGAWIAGCGHAGDGNVHLAVFQKDPDARSQVMHELFRVSMELGGVISGEHGIGTAKKPYFLALEDPAKVALMQRIKASFDPAGILNPGTIFDPEVVG